LVSDLEEDRKDVLPVVTNSGSYANNDAKKCIFSERHVLLVPGGTRGIGLSCAQHFVECHGVSRIVLMARESLPQREEWHDLKRFKEETQNKILSIQRLEEQGVVVRSVSTSLLDEDALRDCLGEIVRELGAIGGVLH